MSTVEEAARCIEKLNGIVCYWLTLGPSLILLHFRNLMAAAFVWIILLPTDLTLLPQANTWGTDVDLPVIPAMADTVIEKTGTTETLIANVPRVVATRWTAIVTEGTVETGENVGVRPQHAEAAEDTRLNIDAEEATRGARRGGGALVATGSQTVRAVLASLQQMVQIHDGE